MVASGRTPVKPLEGPTSLQGSVNGALWRLLTQED